MLTSLPACFFPLFPSSLPSTSSVCHHCCCWSPHLMSFQLCCLCVPVGVWRRLGHSVPPVCLLTKLPKKGAGRREGLWNWAFWFCLQPSLAVRPKGTLPTSASLSFPRLGRTGAHKPVRGLNGKWSPNPRHRTWCRLREWSFLSFAAYAPCGSTDLS